MAEISTNYEPYFLADRIHDRAVFVAELLKFYPGAPTEQAMKGMWSILEDIAADAKKVMQTIDPANALRGEGQDSEAAQEVRHA